MNDKQNYFVTYTFRSINEEIIENNSYDEDKSLQIE